MSKLKQVLQQQAAAKAAQEAHEAQAAVATTPTLSWKDKLQASVAAPVAAVTPVAPVAPVVPQVQSPEEAGQDALNGLIQALAANTTMLSAPLGPTVVEYPIGFGRVRVTIELVVDSNQ